MSTTLTELETLPHLRLETVSSRKSGDGFRRSSRADGSKSAAESLELAVLDVGDVTPVVTDEEQTSFPAMTKEMKLQARLQMFALCFSLFIAGWDGGTMGPMLPRLQEHYGVNFTVVSMIFVVNCVGFLCGAGMNVYLTDRWGFGMTIFLGSLGQIAGYAIMAPGPPFPVFCVAFLLTGWGIALQDAQANAFVASLKENAAAKMGVLHALYGFGAVCSPLAATQFAQLPRWSFHFLVSTGIAVINTIIIVLVFRGKTQDECLKQIGQPSPESGTSEDSKYRQILSQKVVHLLAFFSLVYVGIEVTIGGWMVTYIIQHRGGGPSAGYISTGFFGGLTLGRVALLWVNEKIGERRVIFVYTIISIVLQLTIWFVPSLIGNAVAVALVGFFFGPMYPILMNESGRLIPPWLLTGSIGWIGGFGFSGSALFPFITGTLASKFGIKSLQPFLVSLMVVMFIIWALVPKAHRRLE